MELLAEYGVDPAGRNAVVIGRSEIVGRPAAMLLLQAHATVTICHSRTADLGAEIRRADIVVAAVGVPGIVTAGDGEARRLGDRRGHDAHGRRGSVGDVDPAVVGRRGAS